MAGVVAGSLSTMLALPARTGKGAGLPVTDQPLLSAGLHALFNRDVIVWPSMRPGTVATGRVLTAAQDVPQAAKQGCAPNPHQKT